MSVPSAHGVQRLYVMAVLQACREACTVPEQQADTYALKRAAPAKEYCSVPMVSPRPRVPADSIQDQTLLQRLPPEVMASLKAAAVAILKDVE